MSVTRSRVLATIIAIGVLSFLVPERTFAQPKGTTAQPDAFDQAMAECRQLDEEFNKHTAAGEREAALALAQKQLPLERRTLELGLAKFPGDENAARQLASRVIGTLNYVANVVMLKKQFTEAKALYQESAERAATAYGEDNWRVREYRAFVVKLDQLAKMPPAQQDQFVQGTVARNKYFELTNKGDVAGAGQAIQSALENLKAVFGERHFEVAACLVNLATWNDVNNQPEVVAKIYVEALPILRSSLGAHPLTSEVINNQGLLALKKQDFPAAELLLREAYEMRRTTLTLNHANAADSALVLGITLFQLHRYQDAVPLLQYNREFLEQRLGANSPQLDNALFVLGQCLTRLGDYPGAEQSLDRVVNLRRAQGEETEPMLMALYRLGEVHKSSGAAAKGVATYEQAVAIARKILGPENIFLGTLLNDLGIQYYKLKSFSKAQPLFEEAIAVRKKSLGHDRDEQIAAITCNLGHVHRDRGELDKAETFYKAAIALAEANNFAGYVTQFGFELAGLHHLQKKYAEAEAGYRKSIEAIEKSQGPVGATGIRERLGALLVEQEKFAAAKTEYEQLLAIAHNAVGPDHAFSLGIEQKLASIYQKLGDQASVAKIVATAKARAERAVGSNNLKQLGLALMMHQDAKGSYPAAGSATATGPSRLSWRVHILPYLEQQSLYEQFKLDEPWDSTHNKTLLAKMPDVFKSPGTEAAGGKTGYLAVRGADTAFGDGAKGLSVRDFRDGMSNTVLVVEADPAAAVEWTRPADWQFDAAKPTAGLGTLRQGKFNVVFADGSVQSIPADISAEKLKPMLTPAGGDTVER